MESNLFVKVKDRIIYFVIIEDFEKQPSSRLPVNRLKVMQPEKTREKSYPSIYK